MEEKENKIKEEKKTQELPKIPELEREPERTHEVSSLNLVQTRINEDIYGEDEKVEQTYSQPNEEVRQPQKVEEEEPNKLPVIEETKNNAEPVTQQPPVDDNRTHVEDMDRLDLQDDRRDIQEEGMSDNYRSELVKGEDMGKLDGGIVIDDSVVNEPNQKVILDEPKERTLEDDPLADLQTDIDDSDAEIEDVIEVEELDSEIKEEFDNIDSDEPVEVVELTPRFVEETFINTREVEFEDTRLVEETFTNTKIEIEEFQNTRIVDGEDIMGVRNTDVIDEQAMDEKSYANQDGVWKQPIKVETNEIVVEEVEVPVEKVRTVVDQEAMNEEGWVGVDEKWFKYNDVEVERTRTVEETFTNTREVEFEDTRLVEETFTNTREVEFEDTRLVEETYTNTREVEFEDTRLVEETFTNTREVEIEDTRLVEETFTNTREVEIEFENTRMVEETFTNTREVDYQELEIVTKTFVDNEKSVLNAGSKEFLTYNLDGSTTKVDLTISSFSEKQDDGEIIVYKEGEEVGRYSIDDYVSGKKNSSFEVEIENEQGFDQVVVQHGDGSAFHVEGLIAEIQVEEMLVKTKIEEFEDTRLVEETFADIQIDTEEFEDTRLVEETFTNTREVEFEDTRLVEEIFTNTRDEEFEETRLVEETFTNTRDEEFEETRLVEETYIDIDHVEVTAQPSDIITKEETYTEIEVKEISIEVPTEKTIYKDIANDQIIYETEEYVVDENIYEETFSDTREVVVEFEDTRLVEETFTNTRVEEFEDVRLVEVTPTTEQYSEVLDFLENGEQEQNWLNAVEDNPQVYEEVNSTDWSRDITQDGQEESSYDDIADLSDGGFNVEIDVPESFDGFDNNDLL
jgi:hypothetical protein